MNRTNQVACLVWLFSGVNGKPFPKGVNLGTVGLPKPFFIIKNKGNGVYNNNVLSERYEIEVVADTEEELDHAINSIISINTDLDGFKPGNSFDITLNPFENGREVVYTYLDDINSTGSIDSINTPNSDTSDLYITSSTPYVTIKTFLYGFFLPVPDILFYIKLWFKSNENTTLTDAIMIDFNQFKFKKWPNVNDAFELGASKDVQHGNMDIYDINNVSVISILADNYYYLYTTSNSYLNVWKNIIGLDKTPYGDWNPFLKTYIGPMIDDGDSISIYNDSIYLEVEGTWDYEDGPFWVELQNTDKYMNGNKYIGKITMEARWEL